jgi:hypothetical protein
MAIAEHGKKKGEGTAEEVLDAVNGTIDNTIETAVFFSLRSGFLCRNN